jgi:hypothetical protein
MVKSVRIYRNNEFVLLPLNEYLKAYNSEIPEGWQWYSEWINKVFNIQTEFEYDYLSRETQVESFNVSKIKESYIELKNSYVIFDDDILRFIAFLSGTSYFFKIGNPTIDQWLNSNDINHPFKKEENIGAGFSFQDVIQHGFGQNAIRKILLSTLKWIGSQGG